jgi:phosphoribosylformylglycinamidine cyclo-ligase
LSEQPPPTEQKALTYRESGVDIDRANLAKRRIRELARSTFNQGVVTDIGSFAGVFRPDFTRFAKPVLLASADGVGTKLKVAFLAGIHHTVGIDLVSHCTNDILVCGATPLFFMDYLACGRLDPGVIERVVEGLAAGCRQARCVLLGGETAEMPDFYQPGEYDLAGFIVGIADESRIYDRSRVQAGDVLVGLASSGLHTNGYSLVRKLFFERERLSVGDHVPELGRTVAEELLEPHRNYLDLVEPLMRDDLLHAMAHVTGGGITENLDRALPPSLDAVVRRGSWEVPAIFRFIQERGRVETAEMLRTFNMGIGMILVVGRDELASVEAHLRRQGEAYFLLGEVRAGEGRVVYA